LQNSWNRCPPKHSAADSIFEKVNITIRPLSGAADIETLAAKPVSQRANSVKNNDPDLIEKIEQAA
jgi:hypothetical protein